MIFLLNSTRNTILPLGVKFRHTNDISLPSMASHHAGKLHNYIVHLCLCMRVYTITIDASHICIGRQEQSLNEGSIDFGCVLILLWYLGVIYILRWTAMRPLYSVVRSPGVARLYEMTLLSSVVRNSLPILLMKVVSLIWLFFCLNHLILTIQWLRKLVKPVSL